ncbi:MAG: SH3 domain-containing protein [Deltaproteobacteria bacterium]|nr:SH3 domain-containing protein [Kofleriaceae bacterium]
MVTVTAKKAKVYPRASKKAKAVLTVRRGAQLIVLDEHESGKWIRVEDDEGSAGWIAADAVSSNDDRRGPPRSRACAARLRVGRRQVHVERHGDDGRQPARRLRLRLDRGEHRRRRRADDAVQEGLLRRRRARVSRLRRHAGHPLLRGHDGRGHRLQDPRHRRAPARWLRLPQGQRHDRLAAARLPLRRVLGLEPEQPGQAAVGDLQGADHGRRAPHPAPRQEDRRRGLARSRVPGHPQADGRDLRRGPAEGAGRDPRPPRHVRLEARLEADRRLPLRLRGLALERDLGSRAHGHQLQAYGLVARRHRRPRPRLLTRPRVTFTGDAGGRRRRVRGLPASLRGGGGPPPAGRVRQAQRQAHPEDGVRRVRARVQGVHGPRVALHRGARSRRHGERPGGQAHPRARREAHPDVARVVTAGASAACRGRAGRARGG